LPLPGIEPRSPGRPVILNNKSSIKLTSYGAQSFLRQYLPFSQKFPQLKEHEGSLLCSQEPTTDPYPEPDESSPHSHRQFSTILKKLCFRATRYCFQDWTFTNIKSSMIKCPYIQKTSWKKLTTQKTSYVHLWTHTH
jgi:hypothetical protein